MSNFDVTAYMQTEKYKKYAQKIQQELDTALTDILSQDLAQQKKGAKQLSSYARRSLGWKLYPAKLWFLDKANSNKLFACLLNDIDAKLKANLIRAILFIIERYIDHPMWENRDIELGKDFKERLKMVLEQLDAQEPADDIRQELVPLWIRLGNSYGWDLYVELLKKRKRLAYDTYFLELSLMWFGEETLALEQNLALSEVLQQIYEKVKPAHQGIIAKQLDLLKELAKLE